MANLRSNTYVRRFVAISAWCLIAFALALPNLRSAFGGISVPTSVHVCARTDLYLHQYGWPFIYRERWVTDVTSWETGQQLDTVVTSTLCLGALGLDATVAMVILGSTTLVLRKWLRTTRPTQMRLKTAQTTIAVIAILMALYRVRNNVYEMLPYRPLVGNAWIVPLYVVVPLSIGIACVVFVIVSSTLSVLSRGGKILYSVQRRRTRINGRQPGRDATPIGPGGSEDESR
jgi:hypothetical protein